MSHSPLSKVTLPQITSWLLDIYFTQILPQLVPLKYSVTCLIDGRTMSAKYSRSPAKWSGVNMGSQFHATGMCAHWWLQCPEGVLQQLSLWKAPSGHLCLPRCVCVRFTCQEVFYKRYWRVYPHNCTHTYPQQEQDIHGDVPLHKSSHTSNTNATFFTHLGQHTSLGQPPPSVLSLDYPANRKCSLNILFLFPFGCGITSLFTIVK